MKTPTISVTLVLTRFARLVAARTDSLLVYCEPQRENQRWPDPLPTVPYAVFISDNYRFRTFALDFDGEAEERAKELLRDAGVQFVETASGAHGHRHLLSTFIPPLPAYLVRRLARTLKDHFPSLDTTPLLNPTHGAIRPPFAPHKNGGRSEIIGDVEQALKVLEEANPPDAFCRVLERLGVRSLSQSMELLLEHGDTTARYRSRSEVIQAIALGFVNAGFNEDELRVALLDPHHVAGEKVRELHDDEEANRYIHLSWQKALKRAESSPPIADRSHAKAAIDLARRAVNAAPWRGKAGGTDCAVLHAHLEIAGRAGRLEYDASVRELAERAGVEVPTVQRAHKRLWRILRGTRNPDPGKATRWRFIPGHIPSPPLGEARHGQYPDVPQITHIDHSPPCVTVCVSNGSLVHDLWRWRGLGKISGRVWRTLDPFKGQEIAALARVLTLPRRSVQKQLGKLSQHGLAIGAEGLWYRGQRNPDDVAEWLLVAGAGARQKQRHAKERQSFNRWLGLYSSSTSKPNWKNHGAAK